MPSPRESTSCGACVYKVTRDGIFVLLVKPFADKDNWGLPKGHNNPKESFEACALREVFEETSVVVSSPEFFAACINDGEYGDSYFYTCAFVSGIPALSEKSPEYKRMMTEEGNEYYPQWVPLSRLSSLQVFPQTIAEQLIHEHEMKKVAQK
jgi:ADP-ribose pyrophosphatase YjhB (NUDIX family)